MSKKRAQLHRRRFLKTTLSAAGAAVVSPTINPRSAMCKNGAIAPSELNENGAIRINSKPQRALEDAYTERTQPLTLRVEHDHFSPFSIGHEHETGWSRRHACWITKASSKDAG